MLRPIKILALKKYWKYVFALQMLFSQLFGQSPPFNFNHLTTSDGLANGVIRTIGQDKYGYIWIGTLYGICRYNGYSTDIFYHSEADSFSIPDNYVFNIFCDASGTLWVSFANTLCIYNAADNHFARQKHFNGLTVYKMKQAPGGDIYCLTSKGLALLNPSTRSPVFIKPAMSSRPKDFFIAKNGCLYITTDDGLLIYNPAVNRAKFFPLQYFKGQPIGYVAVDSSNNIWISFGENGGELLKADSSFKNIHFYKGFQSFAGNNHITFLFVDNASRLWAGSSRSGLALYNPVTDHFSLYGNDPLQPLSMSSFNITCVFSDKEGFVWCGTEGYGVNYFNPNESLFHTILPYYDFKGQLTDGWCRAVAEDKDGHLWMGGVTGVNRFNTTLNRYDRWITNDTSKTQLYANSVRSLLYDSHQNLWIGTGNGLNRFNPQTNQMLFFGEEEKVPLSFYWTIMEDYKHNIWIGCRDGLYCYSYEMNSFRNFEDDSLLAPFRKFNFMIIYEDSKHRLWMGTYRNGLLMYDVETGTIKHWMKDAMDTSFINNNIRSITEDKNGMIWIATNEGIAEYNDRNRSFRKFGREEGLPTLYDCELMTDDHNRLWIGSGKGLFVLDSERLHFKSFSLKDGLNTLEFNEQSAFKTKSGNFIYPTLNGYTVFNPAGYKNAIAPVTTYISSFSVFNKEYQTATNTEDLKSLNLKHNENFFSIELTGLHFKDPSAISYSYKLEPVDKDWIFSKDRRANYTNLPGGAYQFKYKATADVSNWNVPEKMLVISIDTIFYKTIWFWTIVLLLAIIIIVNIYRLNRRRHETMFALQHKSQTLEKEKAIVQYENLKQQLNPHFLFNSLTSLRSLIRIDKQHAADFLDKMAMSYRYILKSSEVEIVPLQEEIIFVQTYIELQRTRFGNGLQVSFGVDEKVLDKRIVPVTLQNLMENAIKHNRIDADDPLRISIYSSGDYIVVQNNLQIKEHVESSNKYGLKNLISLYKFLDNRPVIIENNGAIFSVKIPLI